MTIGDNIKKYRKHNNLTQKELGELIGKSTISIRKYEANNPIPSIPVLGDIAKVLNVDIEKITCSNNYIEFLENIIIEQQKEIEELKKFKRNIKFKIMDLF